MNKQYYSQLLEVSGSTGLPILKVLEMFSLLLDCSSIENADLIQRLGVSRHCLNKIKHDLSDLFEPQSPCTVLSEKGKQFASELDLNVVSDIISPTINGHQVVEICSMFEGYNELFPRPRRDLDQFTATRQTVAKRALLMESLADVRGKRILFLGDDDFTSVAVALEKKAQKIQVLDIDPRILSGVGKISDEKELKISTSIYNVFDSFPSEYTGQFDIVFTDPPYTEEGMALFLSRAVEALDKKNQAARIYFCYGNSDMAKERFLIVFQQVINMGLMVRWVIDKFNRYRGAESIGSSSSLFICDVTPRLKRQIKGKYNGDIYTNN